MNRVKQDVDYVFRPIDNQLGVDIEIISGKFAGVVFQYGKLELKEDDDEDAAYLHMEYEVKDSVKFENLEDNEEFKTFIGDIVTTLLMERYVETPEEVNDEN